MTTNIKDNKVRWLSNNICFTACAIPIVMMLVLFSESSRGEDCSALDNSQLEEICEDVQVLKGQNWSYSLSHYGYYTDYPLYLIADADNSSNAEDIIFGFDSELSDITSYPADDHAVVERMRLTDEGYLGIGTNKPDAPLDVRRFTDLPGYSLEADGRTVARFGSSTRDGFRTNHYGLLLKVHSWRRDDGYMKTRTGFNLTTAEQVSDNDNHYGLPDLPDRDHQQESIYAERRVMTMEFDPDWTTPRVAIGFEDANNYHPRETLDVNGAIRIGNASNEGAGTIRYSNGNFEGYNGLRWLNLGAKSAFDENLVIQGGHQIVFGSTDSHRTPNNFLVNSLNVPDDNVAQFPIPDTGSSYNHDDDGTTGGMALVTDGLPRLTVKGNGNTYVHKRLSIGVGAHVPDTVMTVAGAVHIGPASVQPTVFDYGDEIEDYLLWVEHGIVSEDFAVANVDNWSDHVLEDDYDLKPLSEVEEFIQEEGHLPGVPSAEDVKENGYTIHEMTRVLLEKVEELTLHTIAQQKALEEQRAEITDLRAQLGEGKSGMQTTLLDVKTSF